MSNDISNDTSNNMSNVAKRNIRNDIKTMQVATTEAHRACGAFMAMINSGSTDLNAAADALERMSAQYEAGTVELRNICERYLPNNRRTGTIGAKPPPPRIDLAGSAEVNEYGWLHIELNALLPNCRFQTPAYLTDTITRLLDGYEKRGLRLPRFDRAMLVIDEHCDIDSRTVFDQDNKGWKAIPNALKGRVIMDDDQFSLGVALISTRSKKTACHVYLMPMEDAGEFFMLRNDGR